MHSVKPIIIFCQAPADIPYVLSIYEQNYLTKPIEIYVVNVENVFKFLKSLNLKLSQLIFIPYNHKSLSSFAQIFGARNYIASLYSRYFEKKPATDIYFFSRFEDWITGALIARLSKKNIHNIYYVNHYDKAADVFLRQKLNPKTLILKIIYYLITSVNYKVEILNKLPELPVEEFNIKEVEPYIEDSIYSKYSFQLNFDSFEKPVLLFFVTPCVPSLWDNLEFDTVQENVFKIIKKLGWYIVVKGHPRLGIPENIIPFVDHIIPDYIPSEFVNDHKIKLCLGVVSNALSTYAQINDTPTYALLNIYPFKNKEHYTFYKDYLVKISNNTVNYCENSGLLEQLLLEKGGKVD